MRRRKVIILGMWCLLLASLISGCADYGKLRVVSGQDRAVTIETLEKNWGDHEVYWTGLSVSEPSAIMFDPKKDDRRLTNDKWSKVGDKATLAKLIEWIQMNRDYPPFLWTILGPDDRLYGYMYTGWRKGVIKGVDERTLYVYDWPAPLRREDRSSFKEAM